MYTDMIKITLKIDSDFFLVPEKLVFTALIYFLSKLYMYNDIEFFKKYFEY